MMPPVLATNATNVKPASDTNIDTISAHCANHGASSEPMALGASAATTPKPMSGSISTYGTAPSTASRPRFADQSLNVHVSVDEGPSSTSYGPTGIGCIATRGCPKP